MSGQLVPDFRFLLIFTSLFMFFAGAIEAHPVDTDQIRTYLSRLEGFGFSGSMLVAKDGKVLIESHHGMADRGRNIPFRSDTLFDVGSLTKQFTAAAILALEADGKLSTGDPIAKYFSTVPDDKKGITIHHLLTHTSGLPMGFGGDYEKVTRDEVVARAMQSKLLFPPAERHAYSNAGYSLLAAIVEIVSGKSHDAFLRERLFVPAGMTSTGYYIPPEQMASRLARGYHDGRDLDLPERAKATGGEMWNLLGNGGMLSTIGDMYKWTLAIREGKVLTAEARRKFFEPHALVRQNYRDSGSPLYYAYGWYVWRQPSGKTLIWHLGGNDVTNAAVRIHTDDKAVVIYASNVSEFHDPRYPVPAVERMLAGEKVAMPPEVAKLSAGQLAAFEGRYRSVSGSTAYVEASAPAITLKGEGQEAFSFVASGKWASSAELEAMNKRTAEIVEYSRQRNYGPMIKHYAIETTLQQLGDFESSFWKKRFDRHGGYVKTSVLGTMPLRNSRFSGQTIVAIEFEKGTVYREYFWTPDGKIGDLGPLDEAPASKYFPESESCFVKFDAAAATVTSRICFEKGVFTINQNAERIQLRKVTESGLSV